MIEVTFNQVTYNVYTSTSEVQGKEIVSLADCKVGDLVRFNNGHYAECLFRKDNYIKKYNITKTQLQFPGMSLYATQRTLKLGVAYKIYKHRENVTANARDLAFIELVANGMDIYSAAKRVYKQTSVNQILSKLYNAEIMGKLIKRTNMKSLNESLINQGITNDVIASEIANIIKDPNANTTLKKYALEVGMKILEKGETSSSQSNNSLAEASKQLTADISNIPSSPLRN